MAGQKYEFVSGSNKLLQYFSLQINFWW